MYLCRPSAMAKRLFMCSTALALSFSGSALAADFTWTGAVSTQWYTAGNWQSGGVPAVAAPGFGDNAEIDTLTNAPVIPSDSGTQQIGTLVIGAANTGQLTSAGAVNTDRVILGSASGSNGTLLLDGASGYFNANEYLIVGDGGAGAFTVSGGARAISTNSIVLGNAATGSATVTVTGSGSSLTTSSAGNNALRVGNAGAGALNVTSGARLETNQTLVGNAAGSSGEILVSGAGTQWEGYGDLTVGVDGTGTVRVENGADAISGSISIGTNSASSGNSVILSDASRWTVYNNVSIGGDVSNSGSGGAGQMSVLSGSVMTASAVLVGNVSGSTGTLSVDGAGSGLTISAGLRAGASGTGVMAISNGATVTADHALVGETASGDGTISVDGAGSSLSLTNGLVAGVAGAGSVTVDAGGALNTNGGVIGQDTASIGGVAVGNGSTWTNLSDMTVGGSGTGVLAVTDGGAVTSRTTVLGATSTGLGLAGVAGSGSLWAINGDLSIGESGMAVLAIADGGQVTSTASVIGNLEGSVGGVGIDGSGSSWVVEGPLRVGAQGTGALSVSNGGTVSASSLTLAESAGSAAVLTIGGASGAAAEAAGNVNVDEVRFGAGAAALVFNHTGSDYIFAPLIDGEGTISVESGTTRLTADNTNTGMTEILASAELRVGDGETSGTLGGDVEIASGGTLAFDRADDIEFRGTISGEGTLEKDGSGSLRLDATYDDFTGTASVTQGALFVDGDIAKASVSVADGALIGGAGTIGTTTVSTGGIFQSGDRNGALTVNGDLTFGPDAFYRAFIQENYDVAVVTGDVTFDDTALSIDFGSGAALQKNYTLLTAGSISGNYDVSYPELPSHFRGTVSEQDNSLLFALAYVGGDYSFSRLGQGVNTQLVNAFNDGMALSGTLSSAMLLDGNAYEAAMTTLGGEVGVNGTMLASLGMQDFLRRASNPERLISAWRPISRDDDSDDDLAIRGTTSALAYWAVPGDTAYGSAYGGPVQWDWAAQNRSLTYRPLSTANSAWLEYNGQTGRVDGDYAAGNSGADLSGSTFDGGYLAALSDSAKIGIVIGGGRTVYDQTDQDGKATDTSFRMALNAVGETAQGLYGTAAIGFGVDSMETERTVSFGDTTDRLRGSYSATTVGGRVEAGGRIGNDAVAFIPFAAASAVYTGVPGYDEEVVSGTGQSALSYSDTNLFRGTVEAGLGFDTGAGQELRNFAFNGRVSYVYHYGNSGGGDATFISLPGYGFTITGNAPKGSAVAANIGARFQLSSQADLSINAYGEWAADYAALIASAKLRYIW